MLPLIFYSNSFTFFYSNRLQLDLESSQNNKFSTIM